MTGFTSSPEGVAVSVFVFVAVPVSVLPVSVPVAGAVVGFSYLVVDEPQATQANKVRTTNKHDKILQNVFMNEPP